MPELTVTVSASDLSALMDHLAAVTVGPRRDLPMPDGVWDRLQRALLDAEAGRG
jgi:hypothetical protein